MDIKQFQTLKGGDRIATNSMAMPHPNRWGEVQAISEQYVALQIDGQREPQTYTPLDLAALDGEPVNTAAQTERIRQELAACQRMYFSRFGTFRLALGAGGGLHCYYRGGTGQAMFPRRSAEYAAWQQLETARLSDDWKLVDIHDEWGDVYERVNHDG